MSNGNQNAKIGRVYYNYDYLVWLAGLKGYDNKGLFLSGNHEYSNAKLCSNLFNPVVIFDAQKYEWNKDQLKLKKDEFIRENTGNIQSRL